MKCSFFFSFSQQTFLLFPLLSERTVYLMLINQKTLSSSPFSSSSFPISTVWSVFCLKAQFSCHCCTLWGLLCGDVIVLFGDLSHCELKKDEFMICAVLNLLNSQLECVSPDCLANKWRALTNTNGTIIAGTQVVYQWSNWCCGPASPAGNSKTLNSHCT